MTPSSRLSPPDRNLGLCALGVLALTAWNVWGRIHAGQWHRHSFAVTAEFSFGVLMLAVAALLLLSALFISRHSSQPRRFWVGLERQHRQRVFAVVYGAAVVLPLAGLALWEAGEHVAVAALLWPAAAAVFVAGLQLTGQIQPLPDE